MSLDCIVLDSLHLLDGAREWSSQSQALSQYLSIAHDGLSRSSDVFLLNLAAIRPDVLYNCPPGLGVDLCIVLYHIWSSCCLWRIAMKPNKAAEALRRHSQLHEFYHVLSVLPLCSVTPKISSNGGSTLIITHLYLVMKHQLFWLLNMDPTLIPHDLQVTITKTILSRSDHPLAGALAVWPPSKSSDLNLRFWAATCCQRHAYQSALKSSALSARVAMIQLDNNHKYSRIDCIIQNNGIIFLNHI